MANAPTTFRDRLYLALHLIPGGSLLFAIIPLVVFGYLGWYYYAAEKIDRTFYALKPDQIEISTQPDWLKTSVLEDVYKSKRLDRINVLDPSSNADIASAFETHPAVKSATRVRKFSNTVFVDLIYRQPVALISLPHQNKANAPETKGFSVFALDGDGYIVPISEEYAQRLISDSLVIDIEDVSTQPGAAYRYADVRVHQALKLATFLESSGQRKNLGLQWMNVRRDDDVTSGRPWLLLLRTMDGRQVIWGHTPGEEIGGEESPERKLLRLANWLRSERENGTSGGQIDLSNRSAAGQTVSVQGTSPD
jgi:hypothetical protein